MSSPPTDAQLAELRSQVPALSELYDRFAHALEPFDEGRDRAEQQFEAAVSGWYDTIEDAQVDYQSFRKAIIRLCKEYLKATRPRIEPQGRGSVN